MKSIHYSRVISLSREIHPAMPTWPEDPQVEFQTASQLNTQGYYCRRFSMSEHGGTHINAPNSFHDDGSSIDQYPAESLVVSAVVVDVVEQVRANSDYAMTVDDLARWEGQHGAIPARSVVLLYTGWDSKWSRAQEYLGTSHDGGLHFPGFSGEVVRRFLNDRNAGGLGIDTPGVEPAIDLEFTVNRLALEQQRIVLENLCNLGSLPATGVTLAIGLLRLRGGTGSPASVLAFVP
jgi:kynurenine formamidase